jgi:hypothetical protein
MADSKTHDPFTGTLDDLTLDAFFARDPGGLTDDELRRYCEHTRAERAMWEEKQKKKGKVE